MLLWATEDVAGWIKGLIGHSRGSLVDKITEKTVESGGQVHKEMKVLSEIILETISMVLPEDLVSFFPMS